ncbi:MAG: AMP-binding protein, partial [Myxococcales bacterium]|nr:AMP-binding protein [Myxococcales bacterium]
MDRWPLVEKDLSKLARPPVVADLDAERGSFTWEAARARLDGLPGGGLNIAWEAVHRHVAAHGDRVAMRWVGKDGTVVDITTAELSRRANRFSNALGALGVSPGERVFFLLGRVPELVEGVIGTLAARCVASPLFSAFGPDPIAARITIGEGVALVTTASLYRKKVAPIRDRLTSLRHVLIVGEGELPEGTTSFAEVMSAASDAFEVPPTDPEDMALLHFTSGTTGKPKGAVHVHQAVVHHAASGRFALDLQEGDVYWCTADP